VVLIAPWQKGWCPSATLILADQGTEDTLPDSTVALSGPSLAEPTAFPGVATRNEAGGLTLAIDSGGHVIVQDAAPTPAADCEVYPIAPGT